MTQSEGAFAELLGQPGVIEILHLRGRFGFMAFHGGNLERMTDQIASEAAARSGASFYGVLQPAGMREHVPSRLVRPEESPQLAAFLEQCDVVVAMHGYGIRGRWTDLLLGGTNRLLANHVASHLRDAIPSYQVIDDMQRIPRRLAGQHPDNPCNLPRNGGVQIELPPRVRGLSPLAQYWPCGGPARSLRFPHTEHLIEGLVKAADAWSGTDCNADQGANRVVSQTPPSAGK